MTDDRSHDDPASGRGRWLLRRRRRREDRLAEDARRAIGYLEAIMADARRLGVRPDEGVLACLVVLRAWVDRIDHGR